MELKHQDIPLDFLKTIPDGIKFIHKHEKEFLVVEKVICPNGHDLMVDTVKIHGEPSIKIDVEIKGSKGSLFIDAFWGSHAKLYTFLPSCSQEEQPEVNATCPTCGADLMVNETCSIEGCTSTRHIKFALPGKDNNIYVCSRLGCPGHRIEITNAPRQISELVSEINYFGAHDDDVFQGI